MAVYNTITNIKVMPISQLMFYNSLDPGAPAWFFHLEEGSSFSLEMLVEPDDVGGNRVVGFLFTVKALIPYNNYQDMWPMLSAIARQKPGSANITLESLAGQAGGAQLGIDFNGSVAVKAWDMTWRIESANEFPLLTLDVTGIFSADLATSYNPFSQGTGF